MIDNSMQVLSLSRCSFRCKYIYIFFICQCPTRLAICVRCVCLVVHLQKKECFWKKLKFWIIALILVTLKTWPVLWNAKKINISSIFGINISPITWEFTYIQVFVYPIGYYRNINWSIKSRNELTMTRVLVWAQAFPEDVHMCNMGSVQATCSRLYHSC